MNEQKTQDEQNRKREIVNRIRTLIKENPQGFTATQDGYLLSVKNGYAVSITNNKGKQINRIVNKVLDLEKPINSFIGGWNDNGVFYLDVSFIENDLNTALKIGKEHEQKSVFDFQNLTAINII